MICPNDRIQMVNFTTEESIIGNIDEGNATRQKEIIPLPSGGIATDEIYETWYVYECPKCSRRVREAYRCEVLLDSKNNP